LYALSARARKNCGHIQCSILEYVPNMQRYFWLTVISILTLLAGTVSRADDSVCAPLVSGVRFTCPVGWQVVDEDHPRPKSITLGNFPRNPDRSQSEVTPAGKSTISIFPMPDLYRDMEEWIIATQHMAHTPFEDHQETKESFLNKSEGRISARCFTSQSRPLTVGDRSCLFTIGNVPLMIELHHTRDATGIAALEALVGQMIESARPASLPSRKK
jgi:hypothetical protein